MTDDLKGLRIVGRELGRGVRPVGFDTLLATSVRRRRRRRRTGAPSRHTSGCRAPTGR